MSECFRFLFLFVCHWISLVFFFTTEVSALIRSNLSSSPVADPGRGKSGNAPLFIYLFIQAISIAALQVHYYSETIPTQHVYCVRVSRRSTTRNCEWRTCPRFLRGG